MKKYGIIIVACLIVFSCAINTKKSVIKQTVLNGSFRSVQGVMDNLSCYCSNGGYVTTMENKKIGICFDESSEFTCKNIQVKGYYRKKMINPEKYSPCPAGERNLFYVTSYKCR